INCFSPGSSTSGANNSTRETCRAPAILRNSTIDTFPSPASSCARWRSDTSASRATILRVMPRRLRSWRTRLPRKSRNSPSGVGVTRCGVATLELVLVVTYSSPSREGLLKLRMALPHLRWRLKAPSVPVAGLLEPRHDHVTPSIRTRYRHALCPPTASELFLHIHTYRGDLQRIACDRHTLSLVRKDLQESAATRILDRLSKHAACQSFYG